MGRNTGCARKTCGGGSISDDVLESSLSPGQPDHE